MGRFPSIKAADLLRLLEKELGYEIVRQNGSHRRMESEEHPPLTFAFHLKQSLPPGVVKKVLVSDVGLSEAEAIDLL
jgi:predicted RNA binding protein YcfA (HicA-like mRNA interferase family)